MSSTTVIYNYRVIDPEMNAAVSRFAFRMVSVCIVDLQSVSLLFIFPDDSYVC